MWSSLGSRNTATSIKSTQFAQGGVTDQRDQTNQHADGGGVADIQIDDMPHLVADDRLEFLAVEGLQQPPRYTDGRTPWPHTRREGIQGIRLDQVYLRPGQPGGDRHLLYHVVELRLFFGTHGTGAGHTQQDTISPVQGDPGPHQACAEHAEQSQQHARHHCRKLTLHVGPGMIAPAGVVKPTRPPPSTCAPNPPSCTSR